MVTVRKLKFDGSIKSEWDGDLLESPASDWLVALHDAERHQKREPPSHRLQQPRYAIHYLNVARPLTILFTFDESGAWSSEAKCDAAFPAVQRGTLVDFVDLDLDVIVHPDLTYYVRDQEVFAERSETMGYSPEARRAAHMGIGIALRLVRRRLFPFDGHPDRLVREALSRTP